MRSSVAISSPRAKRRPDRPQSSQTSAGQQFTRPPSRSPDPRCARSVLPWSNPAYKSCNDVIGFGHPANEIARYVPSGWNVCGSRQSGAQEQGIDLGTLVNRDCKLGERAIGKQGHGKPINLCTFANFVPRTLAGWCRRRQDACHGALRSGRTPSCADN